MKGDTAGGSANGYDIDLGTPYSIGSAVMYPITVSGNVVHYGPLWKAIGTNACGDILASSGGTNVTTIYDTKTDTWTGVGFWYDFKGDYTVSANAVDPPSHGMAPSTYLKGPFTGLTSDKFSSEGGDVATRSSRRSNSVARARNALTTKSGGRLENMEHCMPRKDVA